MSRCVLEPPRTSGWPFVLSPGYKVPPDLATVPLPFSMRGLRLQCPQRRFECSKWHCRHRDVKCIIFSCRNDVMNPYKRSRPDRDAFLWLLTANWTISRVCPTVCSPRNRSGGPHCFPCQIKLLLSYYWVNSVGIMVQPAPWQVVRTAPMALAFSIRVVITVAPRSNWKVSRNKNPNLVGVVSPAHPNKIAFCWQLVRVLQTPCAYSEFQTHRNYRKTPRPNCKAARSHDRIGVPGWAPIFEGLPIGARGRSSRNLRFLP